jgi:serine/threonine-protein kinase RsbW
MANTQNSWQLDRTFSSTLENGHAAIEELMQALEKYEWASRDTFHIQMAIEEAIVNAIEHGNELDQSKTVRVSFCVESSIVTMEVVDEGSGFDPKCLKDPTIDENLELPRGRGVLLIRELMTNVEYRKCGSHLVMVKERSPEIRETPDEATADDSSD